MADDLDMQFLASGVTESSDPIVPQSDPANPSPFTPEQAEERDRFVFRALRGGRADSPRERKQRKPRPEKVQLPVPGMPRKGALARQITQMYVSLGTFLLPFDAACAGAIINAAPRCGEAMENLARENPAVRRAIMAMVETSVWGQVVMAHAPIMLAIAIHHVPAVRENLSGIAAKIVSDAMEPENFADGNAT